jgi:hypothetical protein
MGILPIVFARILLRILARIMRSILPHRIRKKRKKENVDPFHGPRNARVFTLLIGPYSFSKRSGKNRSFQSYGHGGYGTVLGETVAQAFDQSTA